MYGRSCVYTGPCESKGAYILQHMHGSSRVVDEHEFFYFRSNFFFSLSLSLSLSLSPHHNPPPEFLLRAFEIIVRVSQRLGRLEGFMRRRCDYLTDALE
jgi:hypothetical protein